MVKGNNMDWKLMNSVLEIVSAAGESILQIYQSQDFDLRKKNDGTPLTCADLLAHQIILDGLKKLEPKTPILSEESKEIDSTVRAFWKRYWLVDPLDGTSEFLDRNGEFSVNVALIESHRPIMGVVHIPEKGTTYFGGSNAGAYKRDSLGQREITCRSVASVSKGNIPMVVMMSRRHGDTKAIELVERIKRLIGPCKVVNVGSSIKICMIAEGKADLYPRLSTTCEWDTAAAQAVLEAAGGAIFDKEMKVLGYNTKTDLKNPFFYAIGDTDFDWSRILL
ncbi:MAG: 3'(2'),5'-bisphosphate nucleotidase [Porticoccaceae bacterium]|nr:3'(2'),5'-bisphosphate nucleotidase [Porticoccaceae bacterium]